MLSITREFRFEAAHHLAQARLAPEDNAKIYGPCAKNHGHGFLLRITLAGVSDDRGWLIDFADLAEVVRRQVLADYDHADLNELDDFRRCPPTAENMARAVFFRLRPHLQGDNFRLLRVSVFETPDAWATWEADDAPSQ